MSQNNAIISKRSQKPQNVGNLFAWSKKRYFWEIDIEDKFFLVEVFRSCFKFKTTLRINGFCFKKMYSLGSSNFCIETTLSNTPIRIVRHNGKLPILYMYNLDQSNKTRMSRDDPNSKVNYKQKSKERRVYAKDINKRNFVTEEGSCIYTKDKSHVYVLIDQQT